MMLRAVIKSFKALNNIIWSHAKVAASDGADESQKCLRNDFPPFSESVQTPQGHTAGKPPEKVNMQTGTDTEIT